MHIVIHRSEFSSILSTSSPSLGLHSIAQDLPVAHWVGMGLSSTLSASDNKCLSSYLDIQKTCLLKERVKDILC